VNAWQPKYCLVSYECKEQPGRQPASLCSRLAIGSCLFFRNPFLPSQGEDNYTWDLQEPANNPENTTDEGNGFEYPTV